MSSSLDFYALGLHSRISTRIEVCYEDQEWDCFIYFKGSTIIMPCVILCLASLQKHDSAFWTRETIFKSGQAFRPALAFWKFEIVAQQ